MRVRGQQISLWHPRHFLSQNMTRESTLRAMKAILKRSKWSPHIASCNVVSIIFNNWANFEAIWQLASVLEYVWAKKCLWHSKRQKVAWMSFSRPSRANHEKNYVMSCRNNHRQIFALCTLNSNDSGWGRWFKPGPVFEKFIYRQLKEGFIIIHK